MDITVDIRVYIFIIVSLSKVSNPPELFSGGILKDLSKGYSEPPSRIEFAISIPIR